MLTPSERLALQKLLKQSLDLSQVKMLFHSLPLEVDDLESKSREALIADLVLFVDIQDRLDQLLVIAQDLNSKVNWNSWRDKEAVVTAVVPRRSRGWLHWVAAFVVLIAVVGIYGFWQWSSTFEMRLFFRDADSQILLFKASGKVLLSLDESVEAILKDGQARFNEIPARYLEQLKRIDVSLSDYELVKPEIRLQSGEVDVFLKEKIVKVQSAGERCLQELQVNAEKGDSRAWIKLGEAYQKGECHIYLVTMNPPKAFEAYKQAALLDHPDAQNFLGVMYAKGQGVYQDYKQAAFWFSKAANQGECLASLNLATLFEAKKISSAEFKKFKDARQCILVGSFLHKLLGFTQTEKFVGLIKPKFLVNWLVEEANDPNGTHNAEAAYRLGYLSETGLFVSKDVEIAKKWYQFAAQFENQASEERLKSIEQGKMLELDAEISIIKAQSFQQQNISTQNNLTQDALSCLASIPPLNTKPLYEFQDTLKSGGYAPKMVQLPAGSFCMGDLQGNGASDEQPVHAVQVNSFAIGQYEVTFAEYDRFAEATGRKKPDDKGWGRESRPVIRVSWKDAVAYAAWLTEQTGYQYRLPTEAEWEYATRAGTTTAYWWGGEIGQNNANCSDCGSQWDEKQTAPVGSFKANAFGLYDVHGNVWEWTCSGWSDPYNGTESRCDNSSESLRVLRGGSWVYNPLSLLAAYRNRSYIDYTSSINGFRLVRLP